MRRFAFPALALILLTIPIASGSLMTAAAGPVTIVAAGDIANGASADTSTSNLVIALDPAMILTLGDNAYPDGSLSNYNTFYAPTWGRFAARTFPDPGNHDWHTASAAGYTTYFNTTNGLHSRVVGNWLLIEIDSEKDLSTQATQMKNLLAADTHPCEIAFWHKPRWSSGAVHGSNSNMQGLWSTAVNAGVDVVLNGHVHQYERFGPKNATGGNVAVGTREFVVGTGGASLYNFATPISGSQVRIKAWGVIQMTLDTSSYSWQFIKATGGTGTVADTGTTPCH